MVDYKPPLLHRSAHFSTIIPNLFRPSLTPRYERVTIPTPDQDFLDIDGIFKESKTAVLLLHGLEGSSMSRYISSIAMQLAQEGYDVLAMNQRGCSGRDNLKLRTYHSGNTEDVLTVLSHFANSYETIHIIGFSLGGNIALRLAGTDLRTSQLPVEKIVGLSVPIDLKGCAIELGRFKNKIYLLRFLRSLKSKAIAKAEKFPDSMIDLKKIENAKSFFAFDEYFTAPVHGFESALHYYEQCSALPVLRDVKNPALLINARNDTFLSQSCYPGAERLSNSIFYIDPDYGGHVGFARNHRMHKQFWHEEQILNFLK